MDTEVMLYTPVMTVRAVGYNSFMPSYPHIEQYRTKLQELIEFGGSDNEENIRPAFQNCLDAYCHDHRERLVLIPELKNSPSNKPDGTVKDSLRMARGYWEAKDSHDDLDAEIKVKFNRGYPRDNIIFEDSQTAVLVQNGNEAMRVDMSRDGELHRLIRIFLDYELPEIQEFRHAQSQFKTDLPTVLENLRATVTEAEADNPEYQEATSSFLDLCRRTIGPAVSPADVREMLLQHILTKDIFLSIFREDQFHRENNLLWHHALRLDIEETHLPQKTLHNFRVRLMQHDGGRLAFQETTDRIIQALGIRTGKQRLDSTHIMSNIATLTRLGLFCETMRLFLRALRWEHPELRPVVPEGLLGRYLKEEDEATHYEDAHTGEGRRRLSVCARDLYRLVDRFRGTTAAQLEEYRLLERLLREQCHVGKHRDGRPGDDDDDAGECKVPVALKDPKQVSADSLQSPHDPDVTHSGHKGKGYEVQVAETCHEENATQLITHVEVTPSSGSDTDVSVPVVDGLAERKVRPDELFVDTAYGSGRNAFEASRRGTELVSPVAGSAPGNSHEGERDGPPPLTAADFQIDVTGEQATVCPAGHPSIEEYELEDAPERVEVHFARTTCEPCPLRSRCPVKLDRRAGAYVLKADLVKVNIERRRRAEATEEWRKRYAIRAGIEGTNSELKRAHGLGRLRVRGGRRVRLAVYLKALACNFKRMVHARLVEMENTAQRAVGTVPAVAAA